METIWKILEFVLAATAGGIVSRLLTIRARVKSENANAAQAEAEAKATQIENIRKIVDEIYEPAFKNLNKIVQDLRNEVEEVRGENEKLRDEISAIKEENAQLKNENENLRKAIREINPDVIPSKRSENAHNQPRGNRGQFVKKEEQ